MTPVSNIPTLLLIRFLFVRFLVYFGTCSARHPLDPAALELHRSLLPPSLSFRNHGNRRGDGLKLSSTFRDCHHQTDNFL